MIISQKVMIFIFLSDLTMTFLEFKDTIEENDLAILYINFTTIIPVTVKPMTLSKKGTCEVENIYQTKYGSLKAMDLVGKKFGSKVQAIHLGSDAQTAVSFLPPKSLSRASCQNRLFHSH